MDGSGVVSHVAPCVIFKTRLISIILFLCLLFFQSFSSACVLFWCPLRLQASLSFGAFSLHFTFNWNWWHSKHSVYLSPPFILSPSISSSKTHLEKITTDCEPLFSMTMTTTHFSTNSLTIFEIRRIFNKGNWCPLRSDISPIINRR